MMMFESFKKFFFLILISFCLVFIFNFKVLSLSQPDINCQLRDQCVFLTGKPLFEITEEIDGLNPKIRAYLISQRIALIAKNNSINTNRISVIQQKKQKRALIILKKNDRPNDHFDNLNNLDKNLILTITEKDSENLKIESPTLLANLYREIIREAINNYRNGVNGNPISTSIIYLFSFLLLVHQFIINYLVLPSININTLILRMNIFKRIWRFLRQRIFSNRNSLSRNSSSRNPSEYKLGEPSPNGNIIERIYERNNEYIIYKSKDLIHCYINEEKIQLRRNYSLIQVELAEIYSKQPKKIKSVETINFLIVKGIESALGSQEENNSETQEENNSETQEENNSETQEIKNARKILRQASDRLDKFRKQYNILKYLLGSFSGLSSFFVVVLLLLICPILFPDLCKDIFALLEISKNFSIVIIFGALGGFLSVTYRVNNIGVDKDPDSDFQILGVTRIFIAVISSLIIYLALTSEIISLSFLSSNDSSLISSSKIGFISALAGFVERFVPDLLANSAQNNGSSDS